MALVILGNLKKIESRLKIFKTLAQRLRFCSNSGRISDSSAENKEIELPPEPTSCCMSGCSNCVWIKYAQELCLMFDDGDVIAKNKIMEKVKDPSMRAFLLLQLGLNESKS